MGINPECQERWEGSLCTWKIQEHRWGPRPNKSRKRTEHQHPSLSGSWQWGAGHRGRLSANQPSSLTALVTYGILFQQWEKSLINYLFHQCPTFINIGCLWYGFLIFLFLDFISIRPIKTPFSLLLLVCIFSYLCVWCMHCTLVCMWGCVCTRVSVHVEAHSWHQASSLVAVYFIHWLWVSLLTPELTDVASLASQFTPISVFQTLKRQEGPQI